MWELARELPYPVVRTRVWNGAFIAIAPGYRKRIDAVPELEGGGEGCVSR
jgi:hypothetical protein